MEEMDVDKGVGFAKFGFGATPLCTFFGCSCDECDGPPWDFGIPNTYEGAHKEVIPGLQQLNLEVNQIVVEGAEQDCGACYLCCRTYELQSVAKVLTDKGWLARVNAHLGQYGRAADLWHDSETIHTAGGMDTTGPSSRTLNSLYLRVFKLNNPVRQQAMGPPSEVPRPLHMP